MTYPFCANILFTTREDSSEDSMGGTSLNIRKLTYDEIIDAINLVKKNYPNYYINVLSIYKIEKEYKDEVEQINSTLI